MDYKGRTAVVTGASSGIGAAFARELAARGADLVLVARREQRLKELAAELERVHGVVAHVIPADLSTENVATKVRAATDALGLQVDVLVNNAGFGVYGTYESIDPIRDHQQAMVLVMAVVDLTHAYLPDMVSRGDGAIINVASGSSFQPMPYQAVYAASKAFQLSLNDALWAENRTRGVHVVACCPAATDTEFFEVIGNDDQVRFGAKRPPEDVVRATLRALDRGRASVSIGLRWKLMAALPRLLPRTTMANMVASMTRPR